jgi:hypothetical protein
LDIFPSSERASMTRRLLLFVRNTSDSETIPPESWCASGAVCRTGMPNTCAKCAFHAASKTANAVMSSTGSRTRRKMVLFQVLNRWRQYRPTLLCLSHSSWEKKREMDEPSEISSWFKPGSVQYMSSHTVEDGCSPATPERAWRTYSSLDVLGRPPPPTSSSSSASSHEGERAGATEASARTSRGSSASRGASRATHARDRPRPTPGTGVRTSRATFGDLSAPPGTFRAPGVTRCAGRGARRNRTPPAPAGATSATAMSSSRLQR